MVYRRLFFLGDSRSIAYFFKNCYEELIVIFLIIGIAFVLLVLGFEMFLVLGVPVLLIQDTFFTSMPSAAIIQKLVGGINHSTLLAIPFFILTAELMVAGESAKRLTTLVQSLVGHWIGGIGHTTIGGAMAFGSVSGSAPATVTAIGKIMFPELRAAGFRDSFSLGLIISSAEVALLIPPSITLIIYGWITGTSITALFIASLGVGVILGLAFSILVFVECLYRAERRPLTSHIPVLAALRSATWALGLPFIILGGIYSGFFTATEAAVVSVVYALAIESIVYRTLTLKRLVMIIECGAILTSVIFILLAMGSVVSYFVALLQLPDILLTFLDEIGADLVLFLFILNICFFIAGMFIDPNSALLILVPSLSPVAFALGIDPVHLGVIVTLNICIGMITPPFGLDIFAAASTLEQSVVKVISGVWPFIVVNILVLMLVTYVPLMV